MPITLPVVVPNSQTIVNPEDIPPPVQIGIVPPALQVLPPDVPEQVVPQSCGLAACKKQLTSGFVYYIM